MKILQVTRQFYPAIGGIESVIWHLTTNIQKQGHQVDVLALNRLFDNLQKELPSFEVIENISIRRIPFLGPRQYAIAPGVLQHLAEYDLIHLHSADFLLDYLVWTMRLHRKPIIFSTHGLYFHTPFVQGIKKIYFNTITRLNLQTVSAIACDSTQDMQLVRQIAPEYKINLVPNGIDYDHLAGFDLDDRDPDLLVSVGRLAENKRYDRLLQAFQYVVKERPSARLVIIGPDWGEKEPLQQLACQLKIDHSVDFLGAVSNEMLFDYLKQARIWVSATEYESFGVALLEAMAAGCIPVVSPLFAFKQLLGETYQFFVDFDDAKKSADMMVLTMEQSHEEYRETANTVRGWARQYSWQRVSNQFEKLYVNALSH